MTYLGGEKPSLSDLVHYGVQGMKWGVRKSNPTSTDIHSARVRQAARKANANLATARLNEASAGGNKAKQKSAVKAFEKAHLDVLTNEDAVTSQRMTKGEKWTIGILAGPVGLAVIGANRLDVKRAAKAVDHNRALLKNRGQ